mmetsp:Transcript_28062/g.89575  ORF Transcript_28062/g.89575 Transcript_28062/m.89575 type:complete len:284 (+) Transcript_28062:979-1830(+)
MQKYKLSTRGHERVAQHGVAQRLAFVLRDAAARRARGATVGRLPLRFGALARAGDEEGVVAELAQLHEDVHETRLLCLAEAAAQELLVLLEDGAVVLLLQRRELAVDLRLHLAGQVLLDVALESPQQVALQQPLQLGDAGRVLRIAELLEEGLLRLEGRVLGVYEAQQRVELFHVVLDGRAAEDDLVALVVEGRVLEGRVECRACVLKALRLVDDEHADVELAEKGRLAHGHLEGRDHQIHRKLAAAAAAAARPLPVPRAAGAGFPFSKFVFFDYAARLLAPM